MDYSCRCDGDLDISWQYAQDKPKSTIAEFKTLAELLMDEENLQAPSNADTALSLYFDLLNLITQ